MKTRKTILQSYYSYWFAVPGLIIYLLIFVLSTFSSFYFALTRWDMLTSTFIGFQNFKTFFSQTNTKASLANTFIYAFSTSLSKVVFGLFIALGLVKKSKAHSYLESLIFFPTLLGYVVVGITFSKLMHPSRGLINMMLGPIGMPKLRWLADPAIAMPAVILVDFWQGIGITTVIYIAGLNSIPQTYYEAAVIDGCNAVQRFRHVTLPLLVPAINSVLTLSLIGGLKHYELIWTMTEGGPGYATEVLGTVIYKLFAAGNYGLSTAGYVLMFVLTAILVFPLNTWVGRKEVGL